MQHQLALERTVEAPQKPEGYKGLAGFHKYWGKKPTEAWRFLIEQLTTPGEVVLDPFLGSGLIARECADLGRRFIGFDVNPISIELTELYLNPPNYRELKLAIDQLKKTARCEIESFYLLPDGRIASHLLWERGEITNVWVKIGRKREVVTPTIEIRKQFEASSGYISKNIRDFQLFDNSRINAKKDIKIDDLFADRALKAIDILLDHIRTYQGNTRRALELILTASLGQMSRMVFAVTNRGKTKGENTDNIEVGSWVIGYWRPEQHFEVNAWNCFENKAAKLLKAIGSIGHTDRIQIAETFEHFQETRKDVYLRIGDSESLLREMPGNSVKVVLTDPPHGDRIPYLELSEMWNSVLGFKPSFEDELVVSNAKLRGKGIPEYNKKFSAIFHDCARVLVTGGVLAVMFNARSSEHWTSLHALEEASGLEYIGCYPMEYSAGSVVQDNRKGGLKADYVLLYGKQTPLRLRENITKAFSAIAKWSTNYPAKG